MAMVYTFIGSLLQLLVASGLLDDFKNCGGKVGIGQREGLRVHFRFTGHFEKREMNGGMSITI